MKRTPKPRKPRDFYHRLKIAPIAFAYTSESGILKKVSVVFQHDDYHGGLARDARRLAAWLIQFSEWAESK